MKNRIMTAFAPAGDFCTNWTFLFGAEGQLLDTCGSARVDATANSFDDVMAWAKANEITVNYGNTNVTKLAKITSY